MTRPAGAAKSKERLVNTTSVLDQLRRDILSCELPPGVAIYEQELARRFGVSKSPVREALLRLQEHNLVEVRSRSGCGVRPISIIEAEEMYEACEVDRAQAG
jgi:DNA-binding GntR family transcriptional regulator